MTAPTLAMIEFRRRLAESNERARVRKAKLDQYLHDMEVQ